MLTISRLLPAALLLALGAAAPAAPGADARLANDAYTVTVGADGALSVAAVGAPARRFEPRFLVLFSARDPDLALRWAQFGEAKLKDMYNVWTWDVGTGKKPDTSPKAPGDDRHVEDGFDPQTDRTQEGGRTADCFRAAAGASVVATKATVQGGRVEWLFPEHPAFVLRATAELPAGSAEPVLTVHFTPKRGGWFSVGYTGAPAADFKDIDELWQPLIWQEKRFPNQPYLTEAARCPLPATLVTREGVTVGVVADPAELPFQPLPTVKNSRFGVAVRNAQGKAQPTVFAPILGGTGSKMEAGKPSAFRLRLLVHRGGSVDAYLHIARRIYGFRDHRHNALGSLNQALENMIAYGLSAHSKFDDDLRGCAYETDVPGAVKNVSALHPLSLALVTDNEAIYQKRARPMMEYALSREKLLFATDPRITRQLPSSKLAGPCVPLSELTALYLISQKRGGVFLDSARALFGRNRVLDLDAEVRGDSWQNALALYRATGDKSWLQQAVAGADRYLADRVARRATDFRDPDSRGMKFWPSFAPRWVELLELFEETGEKRFLEAAAAGARAYAQFVYLCPTVPAGDVLVNEGGQAPSYRTGPRFEPIKLPEERVPAWRVSEIGLTCESAPTSKGHRGVFLACYAPWMLRLAHHTRDTFLHDVARSAVIGRYTSFPGYHMNTARTTVYEKPDFPLRELRQLNSTTSLHYNHVWPQIAMVLDYLVADVFFRSGGRIDFPSHYAEGYAYLQSKVYGDRPGRFYDNQDAQLWMPKGLLTADSPEVNYLAARGKNFLYLALTNQSAEPVKATLTPDPKLVPLQPGRTYTARVWVQNRPAEPITITNGRIPVRIAARGITALAIDQVQVTPRFQDRLLTDGAGWRTDVARLPLGETTGMILALGPTLTSAYVYLQANGTVFREVRLHYTVNGKSATLSDAAFPFEFTVPLGPDTEAFAFAVEGVGVDGKAVRSEKAVLRR